MVLSHTMASSSPLLLGRTRRDICHAVCSVIMPLNKVINHGFVGCLSAAPRFPSHFTSAVVVSSNRRGQLPPLHPSTSFCSSRQVHAYHPSPPSLLPTVLLRDSWTSPAGPGGDSPPPPPNRLFTSPCCAGSPPVRLMELCAGYPWIYNTEVLNFADISPLPVGTIVRVMSRDGKPVGIGQLNRHASLTVRMLQSQPPLCSTEAEVVSLLARRLRSLIGQNRGGGGGGMLPHRDDAPFRLVNGEADLLPGLLVDSLGQSVVVIRLDSLGMHQMEDMIVEEVERQLQPRIVCLHKINTKREKLASGGSEEYTTTMTKGDEEFDRLVKVREDDCLVAVNLTYPSPLSGWDCQGRSFRQLASQLAAGRTMLDVFTHFGEVAARCALGGATEVFMLEEDEQLAQCATETVKLNRLDEVCSVICRSDIKKELQKMNMSKLRFGVVCVTCPLSITWNYQQTNGQFGHRHRPSLKGQELLIKRSAELVEAGGSKCLFLNSPSL
eukprot:GHVS01011606.1.p1 GENE.GHVS01011606.1~~GHVS01011606.1.p1  ORF type:complete len:496 (+),score=95.09 GHVS01011606.1:924-2411(+)